MCIEPNDSGVQANGQIERPARIIVGSFGPDLDLGKLLRQSCEDIDRELMRVTTDSWLKDFKLLDIGPGLIDGCLSDQRVRGVTYAVDGRDRFHERRPGRLWASLRDVFKRSGERRSDCLGFGRKQQAS